MPRPRAYLDPVRTPSTPLSLNSLTSQIARSLTLLAGGEPSLRLGVTGLSRAGKKTVFITGLVANLLDRGRMPQLRAAAQGRIEVVYLQPQPDDTLPRCLRRSPGGHDRR